MKKTLLILGIIANLSLFSQNVKKVNIDSAAKYITDTCFMELSTEVNKIRDEKKFILSGRAFNLFAAKTISSYLSSSNDFSMNKAYGILDNADGKLYVGGNIPFKFHKKLVLMLTVGTKSNITDKLSEIFGKEKLSNDVSGELKLTYPFFSSIKFDGNKSQTVVLKSRLLDDKHINKMALIRARILQENKTKAQKEITNLMKELNGIDNASDSINILQEKIDGIKDDIEDTFYTAEAEAFDKTKNKAANSYKLAWISFAGSIPISETKYSIAESYAIKPHDVYYYPINGSVRLTYLHDWFKYIKYYINLSYTAGKSNTLLDDAVDQSVITKTITLDTASVVNSTSKVYYSSYKQYSTSKGRAQFIVFPYPSKNKYIGLDFFADITFDTGKATWGAGIPVSIKGKEDKSLVNFELIINKLNKPEEMTIGISLSLPFSSIIY